MQSFTYPRERDEVIFLVFGRIVDPANIHQIWAHIAPAERNRILNKMGILEMFNPGNPSSRYTLHLTRQIDFAVAARLLNEWQEEIRAGICKPDRQQRCWRNVMIGDKALENINPLKYVVPAAGTLKLDYVSFKVHKRGLRCVHVNKTSGGACKYSCLDAVVERWARGGCP